jgi:hypothetical protein
MNLICEDCRAVIQIPDERVPQNSAFRLNCPRCKRKIVASTKTSDNQAGSEANTSLTPSPSHVTPVANDDPDVDFPGVLESLQPGQSAALLYVAPEKSRDELKTMLEGMGYLVDMPVTADHALQRLRFNQYHVVVLNDDVEERSLNPVAGYLASLNMTVRREMFVILLGERLKTADHLQAFVESVDLVLHPDDLRLFVTYLTRSLMDHERFYKVLNECLVEVGRKL